MNQRLHIPTDKMRSLDMLSSSLKLPTFGVLNIFLFFGVLAVTTAADISDSKIVPSISATLQSPFPSVASLASPSLSYSDATSNIHHHSHGSYQNLPQLLSPTVPSIKPFSPSWYAAHVNDPRMGFFFADGPPASSSTLEIPQKKSLVPRPRPRSLSSLFPTPTKVSQTQNETAKKQTKKKSKVKNSKVVSSTPINKIKTSRSDTKTLKSEGIVSTDIASTETSRTFFLTPMLAYLFPVFIAQLFGMGMIPAAALFTLPILLIPLGLTAAVFLI